MTSVFSAVAAGKVRRTHRFIGGEGRAVLVAIDMQLATGTGPAPQVVEEVTRGEPDGILTTWQIARRFPEALARSGLILRVDGGETHLNPTGQTDELSLLPGAEQAAASGADAVALMVYPGKEDEHRSLRRLASLVNECELLGMPVLAESIPGGWGRDIPWNAESIARSARICAEIGADAIKTMAPQPVGDLGQVLAGCQAPVFVLGGPKMETEDRAVRYAAEVVAAGAAGVCFGRNVWGSHDPEAMVKRLVGVVHRF